MGGVSGRKNVGKEEKHKMYGEYEHTIDAKGRMFLPAKFRLELGERVFITRGLDRCVCIYPVDEWDKFMAKIDTLPPVKARHVKRVLSASAVDTDVDSQGRVLIPAQLRERAELGKTVTVIGVGEKAEIWNTESYNKYKSDISDDELEAELISLGM